MAHMQMQFLGGFQASLDGEQLTTFESSKVRALLAFLATEAHRPHSRERLAALLWPDWPDSAARRNLRYALSNLRKVIGDQEALPPFLHISRGAIQFNIDSDHRLDVAQFSDLSSITDGDGIERLEKAVALYQGEFLDGFHVSDASPFEDWMRLKREQLQRCFLETLHHLAAQLEMANEFDWALEYAHRHVEVEPLDESAHRQVMRLLAFNGRGAEALAQYEACREVLDQELGVEPSQETESLYQILLSGQLPPRLTEVPPPGRPPRRVGACPYRGLFVFREQDAPFFFGREEFTRRLIEVLDRWPMIAVVLGSSGSGKSSVVYAGLLPRLRQQSNWSIVALRPGEHPFRSLAGAFIPYLKTGSLIESNRLENSLHSGDLALEEIVSPIVHKDDSRLLLLIDQFEELYTLCPDRETRRRFLDTLLAAVGSTNRSENNNFVLLLTMRADFMGRALAYRPFADTLQQASVLLGPMNRDELQAAVERPAETQGAAFEPGLVERLLDDVGQEPGNLPLLEFALTLLWEHNENGWLTHQSYEDIGRVEGALACYADQVFDALDPQEQERARAALVQLVRPGEGTEDTRRVATREELGDENWSLTQHLAGCRLVVTGTDPVGHETAEVVHEALIQRWDRFREWMQADRAFRAWQERLRVNLRQWQESGQDKDALLAGVRLSVAEEWLAERAGDLSKAELDYIQASLDERQAQLEAEAERQRREAALERRSRRFLYALVAIFLAAAMLASGLAFLARQAQTEAEAQSVARATQQAVAEAEAVARATQHAIAEGALVVAEEETLTRAAAEVSALQQAEMARARELSLAAVNNLPLDPELSILLALEAVSITQGSGLPVPIEVESSLHRAVQASRALYTIPYPETPPRQVVYSPNGERLAVLLDDGTISLLDPSSGQETLKLLISAQGGITFSPEGEYLVSYESRGGGVGGVLKGDWGTIWDTHEGQKLLGLSGRRNTKNGHEGPIQSFAFSTDGMRVATGGEDSTARIWDIGFFVNQEHSKQEVVAHRVGNDIFTVLIEEEHILSGHSGPVNAVAFDPGGNILATASSDGTLKLWDIGTGEELLTLHGHQADVTDVAFSPDGELLASASSDRTARLWDASTGELVNVLQGHASIVLALDFSPDGSRLATASQDGTARVWDVATSEWLYSMAGHQGAVSDIAYSPDGGHLATTGSAAVKIWDASDGGQGEQAVIHWGCQVTSSNLSQDGSLFIQGCASGQVILRDAISLQEISVFTPDVISGTIDSVALSPDGALLAAAQGVSITLWELASSQMQLALNTPSEGVGSLIFSPDGGILAAGGGGNNILIWDAASGEELLSMTSYSEEWDEWWLYKAISTRFFFARDSQVDRPGKIASLAFSPDGRRMVSVDTKMGIARVWELPDGNLLHDELGGIFQTYQAAVFSPDGARLATVGLDSVIKVWDVTSGKRIWSMPPQAIAEGFERDNLFKWYQQRLMGASAYAGTFRPVAYNPDGTLLAAALPDGTLKVWDADTSTEAFSFSGPTYIGVYFTPDGSRLVGISADGHFRVFSLKLDELVELARSRLTRGWKLEECREYLHTTECPAGNKYRDH